MTEALRGVLRLGPGIGRYLLALATVLALASCAGAPPEPPTSPEAGAYSPLEKPAYAEPGLNGFQYTPLAADKVLVLKSQRKLVLLDDGTAIRTYPISLGFEPRGHKRSEGDGRTPEGQYVLDWKNRNSEFYKSIHISYPNAADRARAAAAGNEPGDNIMIHGLGPKMAFLGETHRSADWTNGCIAVTNAEMDEIWRLVQPGTPIEIRP